MIVPHDNGDGADGGELPSDDEMLGLAMHLCDPGKVVRVHTTDCGVTEGAACTCRPEVYLAPRQRGIA